MSLTEPSAYDRMVDRLARVTTSGRRIRELDGLRFIAIITVFVQHAMQEAVKHWSAAPATPPRWDLPARLVDDWRIGVQLFFVISGFILAMPFAVQHLAGGRPVSLKAYYWRRLTRLEPPYLLALGLCFLLLVFYWGKSPRELAPHLLASALYVHNIVYHEFSTINSVAWSLEIEVQFYVLAPVMACVFMIRRAWLRRGLLVLFTLFLLQGYKLLARNVPNMPETLITYLPMFLMGFLLADVYLVDWKEQPKHSLWGDFVALPGWLLLPFYFQQKAMLGRVILPPSAFPFILLVLCWASLRSEYVRRVLASSFIMTVGGMCYTIYLLHLPMLRIMAEHCPIPLGTGSVSTNMLLYSLIWGIPVLGVSIFFFLAIEKPCMRKDWPQRLWAWMRGRSTPVGAAATAPVPENQPVP